MSFPRYSQYKDSGIDWLGEVPVDWDLVPLKHIAEFINGAAFKPTEWRESGIPIIRIENLNGCETFNYYDGELEKRYQVHCGDLLFGWSGNRGTSFGPFIWNRPELCALNQHIFRVVPHSMEVATLYWILKAVTLHVEDQAHGIIGMVHVTKGDLGVIAIPVPTRDEQTAIATFLDRETAKIDALVAQQRRLIELLQEKRQAVISHAVTKGLNPDAPLKPSGIDWLGDVPAHWGVRPIKFVARIGNGSTPSREKMEYWEGGTYPWLNSSVVNQDEVTESEQFVTDLALQECHLPRISPPAVLVGITGQGRTRGMATMLQFEATINQHVAYLKPFTIQMHTSFLYRLLEMAYLLLRTESDAGGSTKGAITCEQLANLRVPVPALEEQSRIVSHLKDQCEMFDTLKSNAEHAIDLLQERRTALISAAVTGKIDVRGLVGTEAV